MRIIAITGAPGVGKTEVGRRLVERFPRRAAWIDTDAVAGIHPFVVDDAFYDLAGANLSACIENFARAGIEVLVISGVLIPEGIYQRIEHLIADPRFQWTLYGLQAPADEIRRRLLHDAKPQNASQRMEWVHLNEEIEKLPRCGLVDTCDRSVDEVVSWIAAKEGLSEAEVRPPQEVDVPVEQALDAVSRALRRLGVDDDVASIVAGAMVEADLESYASHGVMRLPEYAADVAAGRIDPRADPRIERVRDGAVVVFGNRAFGAVVRTAVAAAIEQEAAAHGFAIAMLRDSNHLGRLAPLARRIAGNGRLFLGFVNFRGAGQKVPPHGGAEGRFCTNPLVFGFPCHDAPPVVIDMSTSATSEGSVRAAALAGRLVPRGWLIDDRGESVTDPSRLYTTPPTAFLAPLGGISAHKGSALALACDLLAGVAAGGGAARPGEIEPGNAALFLAIDPSFLGASADDLARGVRAVVDYSRSSRAAKAGDTVRVPGWKSVEVREASLRRGTIRVAASVWNEIERLAG